MADQPSGLRTPLARVRFLGSARSGTTEAWLIHLTSLALVPLTLGFVWLVLDLLHMDYNGVRENSRSGPCPRSCCWPSSSRASCTWRSACARSSSTTFMAQRAPGSLLANTCFSALLALACVYATLRIAFT